MKIDTGSWHYRMNRWAWGDVPKSLCPYVDQLILGIVFSPFIVVYHALSWDAWRWFVLIVVALGYGLAVWLLLRNPWLALFGVAIIPLMLGVIRLLFMVAGYHPKKPEEPKPKKQKQPSLIGEWIHAKHRRICPILQFTEGAE